jgi:hypothetical protein
MSSLTNYSDEGGGGPKLNLQINRSSPSSPRKQGVGSRGDTAHTATNSVDLTITPEIAAAVVKNYLLPMFEGVQSGGGQERLKRKNSQSLGPGSPRKKKLIKFI